MRLGPDGQREDTEQPNPALVSRSSRCPNPGKTDKDNRRETEVLTGHDPSRCYTPGKKTVSRKKSSRLVAANVVTLAASTVKTVLIPQ